MKKLILLASVFFLAGCASTSKFDFIRTGPYFQPTDKVEYYTHRTQVKRPFGVIGTFHSNHFKMGDRKAYREEVQNVLKQMAQRGADAVIATRGYTTSDPSGDTLFGDKNKAEEFISGYAIKFIDTLPKDADGKPIIPAWNPDDIDDIDYDEGAFKYDVKTVPYSAPAPMTGF